MFSAYIKYIMYFMFYISFYSLTRHDFLIYIIINLLTRILEKGSFFFLLLLVISRRAAYTFHEVTCGVKLKLSWVNPKLILHNNN